MKTIREGQFSSNLRSCPIFSGFSRVSKRLMDNTIKGGGMLYHVIEDKLGYSLKSLVNERLYLPQAFSVLSLSFSSQLNNNSPSFTLYFSPAGGRSFIVFCVRSEISVGNGAIFISFCHEAEQLLRAGGKSLFYPSV